MPSLTGRLQQLVGPQDIGANEPPGFQDRPVHMGFRGKVDDAVHLVRQLADQLSVADVAVDKPVSGMGIDQT